MPLGTLGTTGSAQPASPAQPAAPVTHSARPGWKTTEFWLTVAGGVVALLPQSGVPAWAAYLLTAAYTVGRGIAKRG